MIYYSIVWKICFVCEKYGHFKIWKIPQQKLLVMDNLLVRELVLVCDRGTKDLHVISSTQLRNKRFAFLVLSLGFSVTCLITCSSIAGVLMFLFHPHLTVLGKKDPVSLSRQWTELKVFLKVKDFLIETSFSAVSISSPIPVMDICPFL